MEEEVIVEETQATTTQDNSNINDVNPETPNEDNSQKDTSADDTEDNKIARYKQQIEGSKQEAMRQVELHKAYRQVLKDNTVLLGLDNNLVKDIVAQLYEDGYSTTDSVEEVLNAIKGSKDPSKPIDEEALAKKIRASILAEQQQEQAQAVLDKALKKFSEDVKKKYLDEFNDVMGKRKLTPELASREIDKIIVYHNREQAKKDKNDTLLTNMASTNLGSGKSESKTTMTIAKLNEIGMPEWKQKATYPELFTK